MGTKIYDKNGIYIKRFYGGRERGRCYQIGIEREYVQLTEKQFVAMIDRVLSFLLKED